MALQVRNYAAILPNGHQIPFTLTGRPDSPSSRVAGDGFEKSDFERALKRVLEESDQRAEPGAPLPITVEVVRLDIDGLAIVSTPVGHFEMELPARDLTEAEFTVRQAKLLRALPPEFRDPVATNAWDAGHSNGFDEVLIMAENAVEWLRGPLDKYTKRIQAETRGAAKKAAKKG